jgi:dTDP-glucose pyrophosphorylase
LTPLDQFLLPPDASVRDVMEKLDENHAGIVVLVDDDRKLVGAVTDGDVRRAMLAHVELGAPAVSLSTRTPVTAPAGSGPAELLEIMTTSEFRQIPLVDDEGRVTDVALLESLVKGESRLRAVIMAGGFGTRLAELTQDTPKPMLPLGNRPVLERIITGLRDAGITRMHVTTHYRAEAIAGHFGTGDELGVEIDYINEDEPLGTAGALALLEPGDEPVLVMNGDLVTTVDVRAMLAFHDEHRAELTMAVRPYDVRVPYGVVETSGGFVSALSEKPLLNAFVNAGMYVLAPSALASVPRGRRFDMTELVDLLLEEGRPVASFPLREYWVDIGRVEDYLQARADHVESQ